jgi:hypothetical protein
MNGKIIEAFCALMLSLQIMLFLLAELQIIKPWSFPMVPIFIVSIILGCVGATYGIGHWIIRKNKQYSSRLEPMVIFLMCFVPFTFVQVGYGWQHITLKASNDFSTDVVNPPLYHLSKYQRLHVKEVSPFWGFMNIPHTITKAETDSLVFPISSLELKIIISQVTNRLGWSVVRRSENTSADGVFNATYEIAGGMAGMRQRSDLVVRVVSDNEDFSVVDIRSSSPGRRRDLGFNEVMIRNLADELSKAVLKD